MRHKSTCIEKIECPDCGHISLQTYLNVDSSLGVEWYSSYCHGNCGEVKGDPYTKAGLAPKVVVKSPEQIAQEVEDVRSCRAFRPKGSYRGIPTKFFKQWGVRLLLSEFDGKTPYGIAFPCTDYGKLVGWKARPIKKKNYYAIGRTANADPFGLERAFKLVKDTLWITEGEFDAIALDHCMHLVAGGQHPVISLTAGGGSMSKNIEYIYSRVITQYKVKHIVLVLDDDEVGKKAEETAVDLLGDRVYIVSKPSGCKDANDALLRGQGEVMGSLALDYR